MTWLTFGAAANVRAAGQRMSYAEARGMWRSYLTVERFSFFLQMRDVFRELRHVAQAER